MAGRFLKLTRDQEFYEILSVQSATSLTLREPYIGDSGSGLAYLIWNRYYNLPPDVPLNNNLLIWRWPYKAKPIPRYDLHNSYRQAHLSGFPQAWTYERINRINTRYNTGTVDATEDSRTLTGTSTVWLDNVSEGSEITIGSDIYNVESVDSDTQITMVQRALRVATTASYRIDTGNRQTIILSSTPDPVVNLNITYLKKTYNLLHDNDRTEIWEGFLHIPLLAAYAEYLDKMTSERAFAWLTIYEGMIIESWKIISESETPEEATRYVQQSIDNYRAGLYA